MAFLHTKYKLRDIALEELHMGIATNFYHHLLLQDIGENAAMKYVKTLKQVMAKAVTEGMIAQSPINNFNAPIKTRIVITWRWMRSSKCTARTYPVNV
jgi:hypothetical protein